jgi:hypothetical protein
MNSNKSKNRAFQAHEDAWNGMSLSDVLGSGV